MSGEYDFKAIEPKWQQYWLKNKTFKVLEDPSKKKFYALDMFPYPSGDGLHVGHPEGYTATDIVCRYKRMQGFNVLHPMGWDAFGLPAEQHAIKTGTHPAITTKKNIARFKEQIQSLGFSYDWDREVNTSSPEYYRWTQWIFIQLYEKGLAYESEQEVNWCEALGTVLANEEVINGKSEVGDHPVAKKPMRQWVLKITEYAERLLEDLEDLDWPHSIKEMQRNWIGRSEGAEVVFSIADGLLFEVFTTRPDTLFGATFCVLAPEHPLVEKIAAKDKENEVKKYIEASKNRTEIERLAVDKDKTGLFIGAHAINPANNKKVPIYIADYVMMGYGTGAIMAVPGHDERDHAFATKYKIPIVRVLTGGEEDIEQAAHPGEGTLVNSGFLDGKKKADAIKAMIQWLEKEKKGKGKVTYKLRDWLFCRQRYWGEPFPIVHGKDGKVHLLKESDLPIVLPELEDFKPTGTGESPLAKAKDWLKVGDKTRETNTMPQWAGSCWYYLRFTDPTNDKAPFDKKKEKYWMPVDLYVGGAEHAVLHLLYARFWHKVLFDLGYVSTKEPFKKLVNQGMIQGENGEKMSKSRGNVVSPDDVVAQWGADSLRLYEMFMGPLVADKPWQTAGIGGVHRFLKRFWRLYVQEDGSLSKWNKTSADTKKLLHKTIKKVGEDIENLSLNTGISAMMELVNHFYKISEKMDKETAETFVKLLAPYSPHMGEELWNRLGHPKSIAYEHWPKFDPKLTQDDTITISVQVNGKLRGTLEIDKNTSKEQVLTQAKALEKVQKQIAGKTIRKEIYVPGRIVNVVVS